MTGPETTGSDPVQELIDPQQWVDQHGDYLFRYALHLVRRADVAEDLVQDTLLAAWRGRERYAGAAKERSWLTAILKRKVIDWLRQTVRERNHLAEIGADEPTDDMFNGAGKWRNKLKRWMSGSPAEDVERIEFWTVIQGCANKLPSRLREVFVLWHLEEQTGKEIC